DTSERPWFSRLLAEARTHLGRGPVSPPVTVAGMGRTPWLAAVLLATVLASSCSASDTVQQAPRTGSGGSSAPAGGSPSPTSAPGCPAKYAAPDPNRPRIPLTFDLSADLSTVTGTERVRFVPDLPVREVVFRLTANGPTAVRTGSAVTV